jgi:hypothetical protein
MREQHVRNAQFHFPIRKTPKAVTNRAQDDLKRGITDRSCPAEASLRLEKTPSAINIVPHTQFA